MLWLAFDEIQFSEILIPMAISTFPDVDLHFQSHRNIITHSVIIWLVVCFFNFTMITVLSLFSIGLHLLFDVRMDNKKWKGYYTLKLYRQKPAFPMKPKHRGLLTTIWFIVNFLISTMILTVKMISL